MRKGWALISLLGLCGCTGYSKQVVQLHLSDGEPSQSTVIKEGGSVHVTSTTNVIQVHGISQNAIFELEPNPPLNAFLEARLALLINTVGVRSDCSVASVSMEVRNNFTKGTVATELALQCNISSDRGQTSRSYFVRDVRAIKAKFSGVDFKEELQPGLEACLQKIAPALDKDMDAARSAM